MKKIESLTGRKASVEARDATPGPAVRITAEGTPIAPQPAEVVFTLDVLLPALAEELGLFILPESALPEVESRGAGDLAAGTRRVPEHWTDEQLHEVIAGFVAILLHRQRARTAEMEKTDAEIAALGDALVAKGGITVTRADLERLHKAGVRVVAS